MEKLLWWCHIHYCYILRTNVAVLQTKFASAFPWMKMYEVYQKLISWWCHQMETFSMLLALCEGNPLVTSGFPSQRTVTWSFVFFDLCLNKRLSKQSRCQRFETLSCSLWCCDCNATGHHECSQAQSCFSVTHIPLRQLTLTFRIPNSYITQYSVIINKTPYSNIKQNYLEIDIHISQNTLKLSSAMSQK